MTTPNMGLDLPIPGTTPDLTAASMNNTAFERIDLHDHSNALGVQITPAGMNINADLTFNSHYALDVLGVKLTAAASVTGVNVVYSKSGNLVFVNSSGVEVPITSGSDLAGVPGSITGLTSPASGSYSAVTKTLSFFQDSAKPAKLVISDIKLYKFDDAAANPITIAAPTVGSAYTWTLPTAQATNAVELVTTDNAGQLDTALLAGTTNQITVVQSPSAVTLSLPQNIHTGASPTFAGLTLTTLGVTGVSSLANGTVLLPALAFTSDADTGIYRVSSNSFGITAGGVQAATFTGSAVTVNALTVTGAATFNSSIQFASDGSFKAKVFSGTLTAGNTVVLTVSGTILSVNAFDRTNFYPIVETSQGDISGSTLYFSGGSSSTQGLSNPLGSSVVYRAIIFYQ